MCFSVSCYYFSTSLEIKGRLINGISSLVNSLLMIATIKGISWSMYFKSQVSTRSRLQTCSKISWLFPWSCQPKLVRTFEAYSCWTHYRCSWQSCLHHVVNQNLYYSTCWPKTSWRGTEFICQKFSQSKIHTCTLPIKDLVSLNSYFSTLLPLWNRTISYAGII